MCELLSAMGQADLVTSDKIHQNTSYHLSSVLKVH